MKPQTHSKDPTQCFGDDINHQDGLLRFVHGPDGRIWFDPSGEAEGEALYVRPEREVFDNIWDLGLLGDVLKAEQEDHLITQTENALCRRFLQSLSLAKKASQLIVGLEKIKECLKKQKLSAVFIAEDAGKNAISWAETQQSKGLSVIKAGSQEQLSSATGVANCTVIGLKPEQNSIMVLKTVRKYTAFCKPSDE